MAITPAPANASYVDAWLTDMDGVLVHDDRALSPSDPLAQVSRFFATYNLVVAPVVDGKGLLVGAVTVDDVLDHMLPDDWRGEQMDEVEVTDLAGAEVSRG